MGEIRKKVCMVGAFAVGKTSLVQRFVESIFDERYQTTIGVKIDKKTVRAGDAEITLMLWDLAGEDEASSFRLSYVRGGAACVFVVDGTRRSTLDVALRLRELIVKTLGDLPCVMALNKVDCRSEWQFGAEDCDRLVRHGWTIVETSAKTGDGVEKMFAALAEKLANEAG